MNSFKYETTTYCFWVDKTNTPYVLTKPFHKSQRLIKYTDDGAIFNVLVIPNYELERLILGFGNSIEVLKPEKLRKRMIQKLENSLNRYAIKKQT
ncbi:WYL domain-containing protein [uncultured Tenacibaculum sp.]|uniref:WYL domain-containing protein n=1 Tax=uncultured Tenacibaculum sp. TaxID=174713 RepID=UPI00345C49E0